MEAGLRQRQRQRLQRGAVDDQLFDSLGRLQDRQPAAADPGRVWRGRLQEDGVHWSAGTLVRSLLVAIANELAG